MASVAQENKTYSGKWETYPILEVKKQKGFYEIKFDVAMVFAFRSKLCSGAGPKPGDTVSLRNEGPFSRIRGLKINEKLVYDYSDQEIEADYIKQQKKHDQDLKKEFKKKREVYDLQYKKLPKPFQLRLDKFRKNNPDFRWRYESYEIFCCTEAVKFVRKFKTPQALLEWAKKGYADQKKLYRGLSKGHSGNSFGCALSLAKIYMEKPEGVVKMHGALAPLVGSEEYGCVPRPPQPTA